MRTMPGARETETPFPWLAMLAIATSLISHSYAVCSLFPYVGYMVQRLGITDSKDEAGFYAGYLGSAFMVGRFGSSYFWGRFADRYGRLPVMYFGLASIALFSVAFGLSNTFCWALASRFLLGAFNGVVAIAKTTVSEVCSKEHEVLGMSFVSASWSIGLVVGPGVGGILAEPAVQYPDHFSASGLFGRFPYLLPNLVGASIALSALPMVLLFLKETGNMNNGSDRAAGFKPLSTSELHPEDVAAAEEGVLEMVPLTQENSLDDSNDEAVVATRGVTVERDAAEAGQERAFPPSKDCGRRLEDDLADVCERLCSGSHGEPDEERLLSTRRRARSSSETRLETGGEGGGSRSRQHTGALSDERLARSEHRKTFNASTGEGRGGKSACWGECLVPMKLLTNRRVRGILFVYAVQSFVCIGAQEVYPLWALSTVANGGLDWSSEKIGQCLSVCGIGMMAFQLFVYPSLIKRIGLQGSQRWSAGVTVPVYLALPLLSRLHGTGWPLFGASLVLLFVANTANGLIFINIALATNNAVDSSDRGALNGLSMTIGSLAKAAGPSTYSVLFAWSLKHRRPYPFDFHLLFYVSSLIMVLLTVASWDVITRDPPKESGAADTLEVREQSQSGKKIAS